MEDDIKKLYEAFEKYAEHSTRSRHDIRDHLNTVVLAQSAMYDSLERIENGTKDIVQLQNDIKSAMRLSAAIQKMAKVLLGWGVFGSITVAIAGWIIEHFTPGAP